MSIFLGKDGEAVLLAEDIQYALVMVTQIGKDVNTKDVMNVIEFFGDGRQQIRVCGENIWTHVVRYEGLLYWYVDIQEVSYLHPRMAAYIGGMMTGNGRNWLSPANTNYYKMIANLGRETREKTKKFKYIYKLEKKKEKITQNHHLHVRLRDLYRNVEETEVIGPEAVIVMYLDRLNDLEVTHATIITYWRSLGEDAKWMFFGMAVANNGIQVEWLKEEGKAAKQSTGLTDIPLSQLYEINVLMNRVDMPVDWSIEKEHRVKPTLVNMSHEQVYKHAVTLFSMGRQQGKKPVKMDFEEYFMQRAVAMPAGAVHDEDPELDTIIKLLPREIKNKKGLASAMKYRNHAYFMKKKRRINAYVSTKYEWGKTRALYGCDFTSHVHADFGLLACEETFPFFIPTGSDANNEYVAEVLRPYRNGIPMCYDYEDMNSQHSFENMQTVIEAWKDVYAPYLSSEQLLSVQWTIDSVIEQYVNNRNENDRYQTSGTLFSGWRLTSFINTALNYCYLASAGIDEHSVMHIHNGDDVLITVTTLADALQIYVKAKRQSIRANMTKMSIGTIAEFLRIDMRSNDANSLQYLARGISTFVHSRIESAAPTTYRNLVQAYITRYEEVGQRGGNLAKLNYLYRKQLFFARRLFDVSKEVQGKLLTYDYVAGGLKKDGLITDEKLTEVCMFDETQFEQDIQKLVIAGVSDYTTYLARRFPLFRNEITKHNVLNSIMSGYDLRRKTLVVEQADKNELIHKSTMKGAWYKMSGIAMINRIRMGVNNILVVLHSINSLHAESLEKVSDPIAWLAILLKKR